MSNQFLREACIESLEEAIAAQRLGADRIEFCSRLDLDGLTPEVESVKEALNTMEIPIMVMVRPRGGDFEYSAREFQEMKEEVHLFKSLKVRGVVFGILKGKEIDFERTKILAELAFPLEVCFHKAIDEVNDPIEGIKVLRRIPEISRVLTSGQEATAEEGIPILKRMIEVAGPNLSIMPAGKVKGSNIDALHRELNAREYHGRSILLDY